MLTHCGMVTYWRCWPNGIIPVVKVAQLKHIVYIVGGFVPSRLYARLLAVVFLTVWVESMWPGHF